MLALPLLAPQLESAPLGAAVLFRSAESADHLIAGVPAVARAVRALARAGVEECWLEISRWRPSEAVQAEIARLAGDMRVHLAPASRKRSAGGIVLLVSGERLACEPHAGEHAIRSMLTGEATAADAGFVAIADANDRRTRARLAGTPGIQDRAKLASAGRRIVRATAKPGDGLVSRHLNRPVSQAISGFLLRWPSIRPIHATAGTALFGIAMLAALVGLRGWAGLVIGALLFQAASIFDGVDGEIARATFRTSNQGALIDSLVDAATNLAFVAGVAFNLWGGGHREAAGFGFAGLAMLALGLTIIGLRARKSSGPFSFDGVKQRVRAKGSRLGMWLTWLTMRDLHALAAVALVLAGLAAPALVAFSVIMAGWLVVVLATGFRQSA